MFPVPHYPSDESDRERDRRAPDLGDVVDRIIDGDDGPHPVAVAP